MKKLLLTIAAVVLCGYSFGQVKVLSNGYMGIGTTSPIRQLQIANGSYNLTLGLLNSSFPEIGSNMGLINFKNTAGSYITLCAQVYGTPSDSRLKENILPLENSTSILKKLKTYSYDFKSYPLETRKKDYGVLAQELELILPDLVFTQQEEKFVNYMGFIPILINGFNEQQNTIENLQKEKESLQSTVENIQQKLESLEKALATCCTKDQIKSTEKSFQQFELTEPADANTEAMKVFQNAPNPFNEHTTVQCYIPQNIQKAELCVYDMQGARVKCLLVSERGTVDIQIQAGQLAAGIYTYLLIGDGKTSDAKQMILTK